MPGVLEHTSWALHSAADLTELVAEYNSAELSSEIRFAIQEGSQGPLVGTIGFHRRTERRKLPMTFIHHFGVGESCRFVVARSLPGVCQSASTFGSNPPFWKPMRRQSGSSRSAASRAKVSCGAIAWFEAYLVISGCMQLSRRMTIVGPDRRPAGPVLMPCHP